MRLSHLFLSLFLLCLPVNAAQASYWLECEVMAKVHKGASEDSYKVNVVSSHVMDGYEEFGSLCMEDKIGKTLIVNIAGELPSLDDAVRLKYNHYNGMGAEGPVASEKWAFWPRLEKGGKTP